MPVTKDTVAEGEILGESRTGVQRGLRAGSIRLHRGAARRQPDEVEHLLVLAVRRGEDENRQHRHRIHVRRHPWCDHQHLLGDGLRREAGAGAGRDDSVWDGSDYLGEVR